jgi:hypothetical protein
MEYWPKLMLQRVPLRQKTLVQDPWRASRLCLGAMTEFMVFVRILTILILFTLLGRLVPLQMARGHKKMTHLTVKQGGWVSLHMSDWCSRRQLI